jgi:hypothetical protein
MSYIESQLQPGEQVLFRINRGRKWYHYLLLVLPFCVLLPILVWVIGKFFLPILAAFLPQNALLLIGSGMLVLIGAGILTDVVHFLVDELALTDRRIVGKVQGAFSAWVFQKINVPLSEIESARAMGGFASASLVIQRKNGKPNLIVKNLGLRKQFAAKLTELINRPA